MTELLLIALTAAIVNNLVLTYFLGICPFLGVSRKLDMASGMGMAVTFVLTVAVLLTFVIKKYVLLPLNLTFVEYVVFIFVIAGTVQLVEMYVRKFFPKLYDAFGIFLPMITTNCAILGSVLFVWLKGYETFAKAAVFAVFGGIGFTIAIVIMAAIREELISADVPASLRGAGITLLVAAIMAMSFMGFTGIGAAH